MINKEERAWKELCEECSSAAKEVGITKADTDRIIKETREMLWKSNKYDELIEKLEKESNIHNKEWKGIEIEKYIREILSFLKGE